MTEKRLYEEYIARNAGQNGRIGNKVAQGAETIEAMLNAGVDLLLDSLKRPAVEGWMDSVRATRIAQRLGKTTGAFFHWWPDQQAFRSDLLGKILSQLEHARRDKVEHVVEELPEDRTPEIVLAAIGELALGASLEATILT